MQFDKDLQSEFRDLFQKARKILLSYEGIIETKKERITTYSNERGGNLSYANYALWNRFRIFERCKNERRIWIADWQRISHKSFATKRRTKRRGN